MSGQPQKQKTNGKLSKHKRCLIFGICCALSLHHLRGIHLCERWSENLDYSVCFAKNRTCIYLLVRQTGESNEIDETKFATINTKKTTHTRTHIQRKKRKTNRERERETSKTKIEKNIIESNAHRTKRTSSLVGPSGWWIKRHDIHCVRAKTQKK